MKTKELIEALIPYQNEEIHYTYCDGELEFWVKDGMERIITIKEPNQL